MSPSSLAAALRNLFTSVAMRLGGSRRAPLPFKGVRQQIGELLQTRYGAALLSVMAIAMVFHAVRSAWLESYRKWYPR